jgi:acetyl-CoA carboxylase beta subunit
MEPRMAQRSYTWATRREGNLGYVLETCTEAGAIVYQKEIEMRANVVPSFIEARRRCIAMHMEERKHTFVPELDPSELELLEKLSTENPQ